MDEKAEDGLREELKKIREDFKELKSRLEVLDERVEGIAFQVAGVVPGGERTASGITQTIEMAKEVPDGIEGELPPEPGTRMAGESLPEKEPGPAWERLPSPEEPHEPDLTSPAPEKIFTEPMEEPAASPFPAATVQPTVQRAPMRESIQPVFVPGDSWEKETAERPGLEQRIGIKWFAAIGIISLFVGMAFFIKYVFDRNLIGPWGKVLLGAVTGIVLLAAGELLRIKKWARRYEYLSKALMGGSFAILFLAIYSAYGVFGLVPVDTDFLLLLPVVAVAVLYSTRFASILMASEAFILGYLCPFIGPLSVYSLVYVTVLTAGLAFIVWRWRWVLLGAGGMVAVFAVHGFWLMSHNSAGDLAANLISLTSNFIILICLSHALHGSPDWKRPTFRSLRYSLGELEELDASEAGPALASASAVLYYLLASIALISSHTGYLGLFTAVLAMAELALAGISAYRGIGSLMSVHFGLGIAFVTLTVPLIATGAWVTIGWAIEGLVLLLSGSWWRSQGAQVLGNIVNGITLFKVLMMDSWALQSVQAGPPLESMRLCAFGVAIAVFCVEAAVLYGRRKVKSSGTGAWESYLAGAGLLVAVLVPLELKGALITLFWTVEAIVLLWLGFVFSGRIRLHSLVLSGAIFLKAVFVDSWSLSGFTAGPDMASSRLLAMASAALLFLISSAIYFKKRRELSYETGLWNEYFGSRCPAAGGNGHENRMWEAYLSMTLVLVLFISALELRGSWVTVAWTAEWAVLLLIGLRYSPRINLYGLLLAGLMAVKNLFYDSFALGAPTSLETFRPFAFGVTILAFLAAAAVYRLNENRLAFALELRRRLPFGTVEYRKHPLWPYYFVGGIVLVTVLLMIELQDGAISAAWAVEAIILIIVGFQVKLSLVRRIGIILFLITIVKVFVFDLAGLETLFRIVSFIVLGVILLLASFIYSRYRTMI